MQFLSHIFLFGRCKLSICSSRLFFLLEVQSDVNINVLNKTGQQKMWTSVPGFEIWIHNTAAYILGTQTKSFPWPFCALKHHFSTVYPMLTEPLGIHRLYTGLTGVCILRWLLYKSAVSYIWKAHQRSERKPIIILFSSPFSCMTLHKIFHRGSFYLNLIMLTQAWQTSESEKMLVQHNI